MLRMLHRICRPTAILLIFGFSISILSVLIGISTLLDIWAAFTQTDPNIPIFTTMQNTGFSLALSIYLFSVVNCLVITNYWIVTKRREMAIRKAFGWSNRRLLFAIAAEMAQILLVSLCAAAFLIAVFSRMTGGMLSVRITPLFLCGTFVLLLFTLVISISVPVAQILRIHPAEVIR